MASAQKKCAVQLAYCSYSRYTRLHPMPTSCPRPPSPLTTRCGSLVARLCLPHLNPLFSLSFDSGHGRQDTCAR